jgi:autotransporter-associated beta strand protein
MILSSASRINLDDAVIVTNPIVINGGSPGSGNGVIYGAGTGIATVSGPITITTNTGSGGHFASPSGTLVVSGPVSSIVPISARRGTMVFSGGGSYAVMNFGQGTLRLGANNGLCTASILDVAFNNAGTFDLNGFSQMLGGLQKSSTSSGVVSNSSGTLSTLTLNNVSNTIYGGLISGNLSLVKTGSLTQTLTNAANYTGNTTISAGTLALALNGNISASPNITVASGATFDVSGVTGGWTLGGGQVLSGNGTINGSLTAAGTVAPGASIGSLTFNNNLTLSGLTSIEVSKLAGTNDQIHVTGTVYYGGTLLATNLAGNLNVGDNFAVVTAGGVTGNFSSVTGSPGAGLAWSFNPTNGVLSVVTGVNTSPTNLTATVSGGSIILSWPADHIGWSLQAQTNSLSTGLGTNWVDVPGTSTVNSVTNTINTANGTVFYRMIYK